jgi:hypothetical protein
MPISYAKSSQSITVKWSASHLLNNLTIYRASEPRRSSMFGISHKSGFAMVNFKFDYEKFSRLFII